MLYNTITSGKRNLVTLAVIFFMLFSTASSMAASITIGPSNTKPTPTPVLFSSLQSATYSGDAVPGSGTLKYPGSNDDISVAGSNGYHEDAILIIDRSATIKSLTLGDGNNTVGVINLNNGVTLTVGTLDAIDPNTGNSNKINYVNPSSLNTGKLLYDVLKGDTYNKSTTSPVAPIVPLPVDLISFNSNKVNDAQVRLDWSTAWEINNRGFEIERSTNGVYWTNIGFVAGNGNSNQLLNYTFPTSLAGINSSLVYYRLKQVDFNGKFEYSPVRTVRLNGAVAKVEGIYPNPAMNRISVNLGAVEAGNIAKVIIMDMTGKVVMASEQMIEAGNTALDMNIDNLERGNYIVNISSATTSYNTKLIKL
jgi:hypothetical protein